MFVCVLVTQSCLPLQPMNCSWPGSSVHGILQARILEHWINTGETIALTSYWSIRLPFPTPTIFYKQNN